MQFKIYANVKIIKVCNEIYNNASIQGSISCFAAGNFLELDFPWNFENCVHFRESLF